MSENKPNTDNKKAGHISKSILLPRDSCFNNCVASIVSSGYEVDIHGELDKVRVNGTEYDVLIGGREYTISGDPDKIKYFEESMRWSY